MFTSLFCLLRTQSLWLLVLTRNGGADGTRTRDLQRDRAVIDLLKEG